MHLNQKSELFINPPSLCQYYFTFPVFLPTSLAHFQQLLSFFFNQAFPDPKSPASSQIASSSLARSRTWTQRATSCSPGSLRLHGFLDIQRPSFHRLHLTTTTEALYNPVPQDAVCKSQLVSPCSAIKLEQVTTMGGHHLTGIQMPKCEFVSSFLGNRVFQAWHLGSRLLDHTHWHQTTFRLQRPRLPSRHQKHHIILQVPLGRQRLQLNSYCN